MLREHHKIISVDDHIVEPSHVWTNHLPKQFVEDGPQIVDQPGHTQAWKMEGKLYALNLLGSPQTRNFRTDGTGEDLYARHYDDMTPGAYEPKARLAAMDEDGVWAQVNFPTFPRFGGTRFLENRNKELASACVQAWNNWLLDEWCAAAPDRFIPMTLVQLWDPELAAQEMKRCAEKGARAISFIESPGPLGLPSFWTDHWDPVFRTAEETGMVICMHVGTSGKLPTPSKESEAHSDAVPISLCGLNSMTALADLTFSGMMHRYPGVKIALSEGGSGWVPYLLERMDYTWARTRIGVDRSISPSDIFRRNFWTCFISDRTAIVNRHAIGVDKLMWESDYPHNDSEWPNSRKYFAEAVVDVPDDEVQMISELNARNLFNFWD
ncbi:amidohydrolase family protein [Nocardia sp. alder85J]|uniref:amidohydrolase family protein n=1 Tax=Nocardia sp. alder85J TaxID=2862949 RepID=UPI001CD32134|nr:amidohydrolase family protein [Nocardia sp. alder85J]MCX4095596.1 amidohydrolase family protein [Nocardia sp. alder85J]